jgi:hypothetical protein
LRLVLDDLPGDPGNQQALKILDNMRAKPR